MAAKTYLNFDLLIDRSDQGYVARILDAPAGPAKNRFTLPFSDLELENLYLRVGRSRRLTRRMESPEAEAIKFFGGRLYDSVFGGSVGASLRSSLDMAAQRGVGLRIRLHLSEAPELADLPWEYLYNSGLNRFFVLSRDTPVVRYLDLEEVIQPLAIQPPLRILAVIASPAGYPALDVEQEWAKLQESVSDLVQRGLVVLDRLQQPTLSALQRRLRQADYHVFHFVGHGAFDTRSQDGLLLMQDSAGLGRPVSGQDLGTLLHDQRTLRLAVLNACEGARTSRTDPFAGTAQSLLQHGIPAVIAMQFEISDEAAITVSHEFYAAVADGYPVDAALAEARKAVFADNNPTEWGTPVLYLRALDGRIFDVTQGQTEEPKQAPREAAAPPPVTVTAPPVARAVAEAATAADEPAGRKNDAPTRRTLPVTQEVAPAPAANRQAAASAYPPARGKRKLWPVIAGGLLTLLVAGVVFSGFGRSFWSRAPAVESSAALPLAAGVPNAPAVLPAAAVPNTPAPLVAAAPSPTREEGAVAALLPVAATAVPTETPVTSTDAPLPAPTSTPLPARNTPPPPTDTSAPAPTPAPARSPTATRVPPTLTPASTSASALAAPAGPAAGPGADIMDSGPWVRGDQAYGTLTNVFAADGSKYGKLDYDIPVTAPDHFVVFRRVPAATLAGQPQALTVWVYGDGSGNFLNLWIKDQAGQIRQFSFGRIQHANSWQAMTATLDTGAAWPQAHISGPDSPQLSYPVSVYALTLDAFPKSDATAYTGTIYLDQLRAGADAGKTPSAAPPR